MTKTQAQGRRHRLRVIGPVFVLGGLFMCASLGFLTLGFKTWSPLCIAVGIGLLAGGFLKDLAVLPTDRFLVVALIVHDIVIQAAILVALFSIQMVSFADDWLPPCSYFGIDIEGWAAGTIWGAEVCCFILGLVTFARLVHGALTLAPRHMLELRWQNKRWEFLALGCAAFIWTVALLASQHGRTEITVVRLAAAYAVVGAEYMALSMLAGSSTLRRRARVHLAPRAHIVSSAAGISAMLGATGTSDNSIQKSRRLFRCISCEHLHLDAMRSPVPDPGLIRHTEVASIGEVDAFVSHSWHDCPELKWRCLQRWRQDFKAAHGREPKIWIDKYCIDQGDIADSLLCLPIFIAGCKEMLVIAGETYFKRLWCIVELYVFLEIQANADSLCVRLLARDMRERDALLKCIENFTATDASASCPNDHDHLHAVLEAGQGNLKTFDAMIRNTIGAKVEAPSSWKFWRCATTGVNSKHPARLVKSSSLCV